MHKSIVVIAVMATAFGASAQSLPNSRFALQIGDMQPVQWKELEPVKRNMEACIADSKSSTPTCRQVQERLGLMYFDALSQALVLSTLDKPGEPRFCDEYAKSLIIGRKQGEATMYSILVVGERMKYGSGLYGDDLGNTYVGKIVFDALLESKPCR
jgi:hypothetical protein